MSVSYKFGINRSLLPSLISQSLDLDRHVDKSDKKCSSKPQKRERSYGSTDSEGSTAQIPVKDFSIQTDLEPSCEPIVEVNIPVNNNILLPLLPKRMLAHWIEYHKPEPVESTHYREKVDTGLDPLCETSQTSQPLFSTTENNLVFENGAGENEGSPVLPQSVMGTIDEVLRDHEAAIVSANSKLWCFTKKDVTFSEIGVPPGILKYALGTTSND